jgi:heme/copper-type cytochrome/quinol oxidase subunit 3
MTDAVTTRSLPVGSIGRLANGWWGMLTLIVTEGALFAFLLFGYFYLAVQHGADWLPSSLPSFDLSAPNTILLLASGVVVWSGERALLRGGSRTQIALWFLGAAILGVLFILIELLEWSGEDFTLSSNAYSSLYFVITGLDLAHTALGVVLLFVLAGWAALGYFDRLRSAPVSIGAIYWYFVVVVWLAVFFTLYVTPRLNVG